MTPPPMPEWLEKKRDEAWEEYKEVNPPKGQAALYYKDNAEYWKDGFRHGHALMAERKATPLEIAGIIESHSIRVTNFLKIINRTATTCGEEMEKIRQDQKDYAKQLLVMAERMDFLQKELGDAKKENTHAVKARWKCLEDKAKLVEALKFVCTEMDAGCGDPPGCFPLRVYYGTGLHKRARQAIEEVKP